MIDNSVTINTKSPPLPPVHLAGCIKLEHVRITSHSFYCSCCFPEHFSECCSRMEELFTYFYTEKFGGGREGEERLRFFRKKVSVL